MERCLPLAVGRDVHAGRDAQQATLVQPRGVRSGLDGLLSQVTKAVLERALDPRFAGSVLPAEPTRV